MIAINLDDKQVTILREHLTSVLSDLSVEIANTDRKEYRDEIKAEREVLRGILALLPAAHATV